MRQSRFTEQELKEKRRQLQVYLDYFGRQLAEIMIRIPPRAVLKDDGTFELLPPSPEWQSEIDKLVETQKNFLKAHFPDFYANI